MADDYKEKVREQMVKQEEEEEEEVKSKLNGKEKKESESTAVVKCTEETDSKTETNEESKPNDPNTNGQIDDNPKPSIFRCVADGCNYESTMLIRYLRHYKSMHSKKKNTSSIETINCPACNHFN